MNAGTADTHNLICPACYDRAGNISGYGGVTYSYDDENRLIVANGVFYYYDGDGNRVAKCASTCASGTAGTFYWRGVDGNTLVESDTAGSFQYEYIFFNGKRVARRTLTGTEPVYYYFSDHLGSHSIISDNNGNVQNESDYSPYGEEMVITDTLSPQNYKFAGKERDAESGFDNFGARYYASNFGRFMTPDWAARATAVPYAVFGDPQSLNLYTYVRNDPVTRADADGHRDCPTSNQSGCDRSMNSSDVTNTKPAQNHGFWWNVGHALGFIRTNEDVAGERQWLQKNVVSIDGIQNKDFGKLTPRQVDNEYARANAAIDEGRYNVMGTPAGSGWTLGSGKSAQKWANQMAQRGWTPDQITEAIQNGEQFPATNNINPANGATRYVNPSTGRSVVLDNVTREVIHVGGDGFQY